MNRVLTILPFLAAAGAATAGVFTNSSDADSFVRSNAPSVNYGGAGSLTVSGATATNISGVANGVADTFIRFNTGAMVTNFNTLYGTNNWVITGASLAVTEVGVPNNAIFDVGVGAFGIRWVANTNWIEGSGNPGAPGSTGLVYSQEPSLLNNATDANLGTFTNTGLSTPLNFPLAVPSGFASSLQAGGDVDLFLTAIDSGTGFTFNSRTFGTASARPFLVVSALPQPGISNFGIYGPNLVLFATNGTTNATYVVLTTTNLTSPANQWIALQTNAPSAVGSFNFTIPRGSVSNRDQFFIIRGQ